MHSIEVLDMRVPLAGAFYGLDIALITDYTSLCADNASEGLLLCPAHADCSDPWFLCSCHLCGKVLFPCHYHALSRFMKQDFLG